ncbi:MAG: hypothetical protein FWC71_05110 [Defluviitaleaceae bacterium]|nr:hypothetical protein [Defluviitaleaceae bacterium]
MEDKWGALIWSKSSTFMEMFKRVFYYVWGAFFVCLIFSLFIHIFIQELSSVAQERNLFNLIASAIVLVVFIFIIFLLIKTMLHNCKKQSVFVYERGCIFKEGKAADEILFCDIKGIQDMLQVADGGEIMTAERLFTMVYHDDTRRFFKQGDVPSYDAFFTQLRQAYNSFFLQDASDAGLLRKPIWMGEEINFDGERFHMYVKNILWSSFAPQDITEASAYEGKSNAVIHIQGKIYPSDIPELLTTLSSADLYNPDLLYWRIANKSDAL